MLVLNLYVDGPLTYGDLRKFVKLTAGYEDDAQICVQPGRGKPAKYLEALVHPAPARDKREQGRWS